MKLRWPVPNEDYDDYSEAAYDWLAEPEFWLMHLESQTAKEAERIYDARSPSEIDWCNSE